jgi:secretion/DNA translocation related CpaE-like protein
MGPDDVAVAVADGHQRSVVTRLAAVAGVTALPVQVSDPAAWWPFAPAVVVDADGARRCVEARVPRRSRVLVVTADVAAVACWSAAVALGAEEVLDVADERRVADWFARLGEPVQAGRLICFVPARGGVGASTLSAVLALAASQSHDVVLLDGDPYGGGIDYVLGLEAADGARWGDLAGASGVLAAQSLAEALPSIGRVRVVSHGPGGADVPTAAADAVLAAALRGAPLVVVDAPGPGPMARSLTARADVVVVVVSADVRGVVAASAAASDLSRGHRELRLVVRHPGPGDLRPEDVADAVGRPVSAVWPWERRLGSLVEGAGLARGWRRTTAGSVALDLLSQLGFPPP